MDHIQIITRVAVGLAQHDGFCCCPEQSRSVLAPRLASAMEELLKLKGMLAYNFLSFFSLAFRRSKNWMAPKVRSRKYLSMSFSASHFWSHLTFGSPEN
jgi:hypothetical protein